MMRSGIERVVDRHAASGTEALIGIDHRRPAAISEDEIDLSDRTPHRVVLVGAHLVQRRGGIDVPEDLKRVGPCMLDHSGDQLVVEYADSARLHHDVGSARFLEHGAQALGSRRIDNRACPRLRLHVPVLLALIGIRFVKRDLVAAAREVAQQSAIIGRGAVPPRRQQA